MKTKTAKQPKQANPTVHMKDLKPKKNPRAGARNGNLQITQLYVGT